MGDSTSAVEAIQYCGGIASVHVGIASVLWGIRSGLWGIASVLQRLFSTVEGQHQYCRGIASVLQINNLKL